MNEDLIFAEMLDRLPKVTRSPVRILRMAEELVTALLMENGFQASGQAWAALRHEFSWPQVAKRNRLNRKMEEKT